MNKVILLTQETKPVLSPPSFVTLMENEIMKAMDASPFIHEGAITGRSAAEIRAMQRCNPVGQWNQRSSQ